MYAILFFVAREVASSLATVLGADLFACFCCVVPSVVLEGAMRASHGLNPRAAPPKPQLSSSSEETDSDAYESGPDANDSGSDEKGVQRWMRHVNLKPLPDVDWLLVGLVGITSLPEDEEDVQLPYGLGFRTIISLGEDAIDDDVLTESFGRSDRADASFLAHIISNSPLALPAATATATAAAAKSSAESAKPTATATPPSVTDSKSAPPAAAASKTARIKSGAAAASASGSGGANRPPPPSVGTCGGDAARELLLDRALCCQWTYYVSGQYGMTVFHIPISRNRTDTKRTPPVRCLGGAAPEWLRAGQSKESLSAVAGTIPVGSGGSGSDSAAAGGGEDYESSDAGSGSDESRSDSDDEANARRGGVVPLARQVDLIVHAINRSLAVGRPVLLHCSDGNARTALVAACFLASLHHMRPIWKLPAVYPIAPINTAAITAGCAAAAALAATSQAGSGANRTATPQLSANAGLGSAPPLALNGGDASSGGSGSGGGGGAVSSVVAGYIESAQRINDKLARSNQVEQNAALGRRERIERVPRRMNTAAVLKAVRSRRGRNCIGHRNQELFITDYRIRCRMIARGFEHARGIKPPQRHKYWPSDSESERFDI